MLCPQCDTELDQMRCPDCGRTWKNALMIFGEKYNKSMSSLRSMEITKPSDLLSLVHELTNLDAAYGEIIDALALGEQIND